MTKRELKHINDQLQKLLKEIEDRNNDYGNNLKPCRSEQCRGCKFAVIVGEDVWPIHNPVLIGCNKGIVCDDYQPMSNTKKEAIT